MTRPTCPHCHTPIDLRKIRHQGLFVSYRICPTCNQAFEVDPKTKRRQAVSIIIALVSLVLTVSTHIYGWRWLPYAVVSYVVLGTVIYHGNKKVFFVKSAGAGDRSARR